ncbi:hypothetical protein Tco_0417849 [Tanacetum coccineum]|uniref:Uncharacterized protein n=1 Tax=Tanacetum coccineum TaxID=301880 RepID=A0ABQ5B1V4_9ASTR
MASLRWSMISTDSVYKVRNLSEWWYEFHGVLSGNTKLIFSRPVSWLISNFTPEDWHNLQLCPNKASNGRMLDAA